MILAVGRPGHLKVEALCALHCLHFEGGGGKFVPPVRLAIMAINFSGFHIFGVWGVLRLELVTFYFTTIVAGFWGFRVFFFFFLFVCLLKR